MTTTLPLIERSENSTTLFDGYTPQSEVFDEAFSAPGALRPHWREFAAAIDQLGPQELGRRWDAAHRMVRENSVTYNAYGDLHRQLRPWELDALPLLVSTDDARIMSNGLIQRAQLLNLILADLYGPQRLLAKGLLPPELVFANPSFRRPYHGQAAGIDCFLHLYAADLVRSSDGQFWVVADRSEAPAGAGYALENRIVASRTFPRLIHDCQIERLAPFFIALRDTLQKLAPRYHENPRIVLLSEGPSNPHFFEDAYLARYLGYTLVEGGDLAVRKNRVMLKTLGGLLPVEVILRGVSSENCDPLELRGDSSFGVSGLLQAVRSGNVVVANALGSGLVEAPALMAYLPSLCRALLGEDLKLPSVATWWCGDPQARSYILEHLDDLEIRPAFRRSTQTKPVPDSSDAPPTGEWVDALRTRPAEFVAQERVPRSCVPVWSNDRLEPWHLILRTYLVASNGSYLAMSGGMARVSAPTAAPDDSAAAHQRSKDAWFIADGPVRQVSLLKTTDKHIELRRSGANLPSRVADNLFWLGRHVVRAEAAARLLRTVLSRLTGELESESVLELPVLLRALAEQGQIEPGFAVDGFRDPLPTIERVLPASVFDEGEPYSLRRTLTNMHRAASVVRDRISTDSWRILNRIDQQFQPPPHQTDFALTDLLEMLNSMIIDLAAFGGLVMESMTRSPGWRLLDIGRRLEQAQHVIGLVRNTLVNVSHDEGPILEAVLEVADSVMTYRSRYMASLRLAPVLDLLLTDETNPRSLAYQLAQLQEHVANLPRDRSEPLKGLDERITMSALHGVRMLDVEMLGELHKDADRQHLDRLLYRLSSQLPALADAISHKYLIHAGPPRQLAKIHPG